MVLLAHVLEVLTLQGKIQWQDITREDRPQWEGNRLGVPFVVYQTKTKEGEIQIRLWLKLIRQDRISISIKPRGGKSGEDKTYYAGTPEFEKWTELLRVIVACVKLEPKDICSEMRFLKQLLISQQEAL